MAQGLELEIRGKDTVSTKLRTVGQNVDKMKRRIQGASAKVVGAFGRMGAAAQRMGGAVTRHARTAALAVAALATAAVVVGARFEQSMVNTASVAGATAEEFKALAVTARQWGAQTAFSATQVSDAMYSLASAGQSVAEIRESVGNVLLFAGATMTDMSAASELVVTSLSAFRMEASESARVANVFASAISQTQLNAERLGLSMPYVATTAKGLGLSIETTTAALGELISAGMPASMAGTSLRQVFATLLKPSKELRDALGEVSIKTDGLTGVIRKLKATVGSDPELLSKMFNVRALTAAQILVGKGADKLDDLTRAITGTTAAADMYAMQMDTVLSQFKIFRSAVEESFIASFETIKPQLRSVLASMIEWVNRSRAALVGLIDVTVEWVRENSELVLSILRIGSIAIGTAAAIGILSVTISAISGIVGIAISIFTGLIATLRLVGIIIQTTTILSVRALGVAFTALGRVAVISAIAGLRAFGASLIAVGRIIPATIAIIGGFITHLRLLPFYFQYLALNVSLAVTRLRLFTASLFRATGAAMVTAITSVKRLGAAFVYAARNAIPLMLTGLRSIPALLASLSRGLVTLGTRLVTTSALTTLLAGPWPLLIGIAVAALTAIGVWLYKTSDKFRDFARDVGGVIKRLGEWLWDKIKWPFVKIGELAVKAAGIFKRVFPDAAEAIEGMWAVLQEKGADAGDFVVKTGTSAVDSVKGAVSGAVGEVGGMVDDMKTKMFGFYDEIEARGQLKLAGQLGPEMPEVSPLPPDIEDRMVRITSAMNMLAMTGTGSMKAISEASTNTFMQMELQLGAVDAAYGTMVDSALDKELTGQKRREKMWESSKRTFLKSSSEMAKGYLKHQLAGTQEAEKASMAAALRRKYEDAKAGARRAYSAFASIPIIGPALGVAAAAAAFSFLIAFHKGGLIGERNNRTGRERVIRAQDGEFVVRRSAVEKIGIETLERINRTGNIPATESVKSRTSERLRQSDIARSAETVRETNRRSSSFETVENRNVINLAEVNRRSAIERIADRIVNQTTENISSRIDERQISRANETLASRTEKVLSIEVARQRMVNQAVANIQALESRLATGTYGPAYSAPHPTMIITQQQAAAQYPQPAPPLRPSGPPLTVNNEFNFNITRAGAQSADELREVIEEKVAPILEDVHKRGRFNLSK
jgi:TP901 family phage tail tape measure protein